MSDTQRVSHVIAEARLPGESSSTATIALYLAELHLAAIVDALACVLPIHACYLARVVLPIIVIIVVLIFFFIIILVIVVLFIVIVLVVVVLRPVVVHVFVFAAAEVPLLLLSDLIKLVEVQAEKQVPYIG